MNPVPLDANFILTSLSAGLLGGLALELTMRLITRSGWAQGDMIVALGSLFTRRREGAFRVGAMLHALSSMGFAVIYALVLVKFGFSTMPAALAAGLGIGFFHGLIVSLTLVWVVAEQHPLEEFTDAGFAVGLSHLAGHVAYGGVVGLVIGWSPL